MTLAEKYKTEIIPSLKKQFGHKNIFEVPMMKKVTVNIGLNVNQTGKDGKLQELAESAIRRITGQNPVKKMAKKSISGFKVRKGQIVGLMVTLRGKRMYDFIEKLVNITLPRIRDFRGLEKKSLDQVGNLSIGFKEHIVFPEINLNEIEKIIGLEVVITIKAKTRDESFELLKALGFPFNSDK